MNNIPKNHPRYESLKTREKISDAMKKGFVHETGLIAHGRGEAFDYILGEKTISYSDEAAKIAAATLLFAEKPVISVNGNVVALAASECISLSKTIPAVIEVNLFHRTDERMALLIDELISLGADEVLGKNGDARIPGLDHNRGLCESAGIFSADVVLVPLEDGDRCEALKKMGKTVIAIDLNPLSRTAKSADITVVDNVIRAIPNIEKWVKELKKQNISVLRDMINSWDNDKMLNEVQGFISKRLLDLS
jgi:4-phosphopantoate--beta-alanine ligase